MAQERARTPGPIITCLSTESCHCEWCAVGQISSRMEWKELEGEEFTSNAVPWNFLPFTRCHQQPTTSTQNNANRSASGPATSLRPPRPPCLSRTTSKRFKAEVFACLASVICFCSLRCDVAATRAWSVATTLAGVLVDCSIDT